MSTLTYDEIFQRCSKGAELLDHAEPLWFHVIDWDKFSITRTTDCVLGQVFADRRNYWGGLEILFPNEERFSNSQTARSVEHGFAAPTGLTAVPADDVKTMYKNAWKKLVTNRLDLNSTSPAPAFTDWELALLQTVVQDELAKAQDDSVTAKSAYTQTAAQDSVSKIEALIAKLV